MEQEKNINRPLLIFFLIVMFAFGWETHNLYIRYDELSLPKDTLKPGDHIPESSIKVYEGNSNVTIILPSSNFRFSQFADTKSMLPTFASNHNAIEIIPNGPEDIKIGDIISYKYTENISIVHRVINIRKDDRGLYYIVKGDNNKIPDPVKVRIENVEGILVALIY